MLYTHWSENNGGYNDGDPPLTIPNREVKPISADDTAIPSGKVGSRQLHESIQVIGCSFFYNTLKSIHEGIFLLSTEVWDWLIIDYDRWRLPRGSTCCLNSSSACPQAQPPTLWDLQEQSWGFFFIKSPRDSTLFYNTLKNTHAESFLFNSTL